VTAIAATAAYRMWASTYDLDPNPLLGLEHRIVNEYLNVAPTERLLDLATGTGRWLEHASLRGICAIGIDSSPEMLAVAAKKRDTKGRLVCADICALPFVSNATDVAVCSFALGYVEHLELAFSEMARVARRIITSDLHPEAIRSGWVRSFRMGEDRYEIDHYKHPWAAIQDQARAAKLNLVWKADAFFGERERVWFERAGKASAFATAQKVPAVLAAAWERQ